MEQLRKDAETLGIILSEKMLEDFEVYMTFLLDYNEKVNLTAITQKDEILTKHFLDSISLYQFIEPKEGSTFIDIGTGAGFPGVPLKVVRPDLRVTLLDSLLKRLTFLEQLSLLLEQDNKLVHARAEDTGRESPFREGYEYVVSRAVTNLSALSEYCIPHVEVGGLFIAYKGPDWEEDYQKARKGIGLLGGKLEKVESFQLPDHSERSLLFIRKTKETPDKYPRRGVKIAKNPL